MCTLLYFNLIRTIRFRSWNAVPVQKMAHVLSECLEVLKPGGLLLFRDYGPYDMTMLRFAPRQRISSCLYQREDGTLSYFFSLEAVRTLFTQAGFVERELEYCCVQLMNRRKQVPMKRVWVHAKFQKPDPAMRDLELSEYENGSRFQMVKLLRGSGFRRFVAPGQGWLCHLVCEVKSSTCLGIPLLRSDVH
jgi:SAM-dependent methyltransferase